MVKTKINAVWGNLLCIVQHQFKLIQNTYILLQCSVNFLSCSFWSSFLPVPGKHEGQPSKCTEEIGHICGRSSRNQNYSWKDGTIVRCQGRTFLYSRESLLLSNVLPRKQEVLLFSELTRVSGHRGCADIAAGLGGVCVILFIEGMVCFFKTFPEKSYYHSRRPSKFWEFIAFFNENVTDSQNSCCRTRRS